MPVPTTAPDSSIRTAFVAVVEASIPRTKAMSALPSAGGAGLDVGGAIGGPDHLVDGALELLLASGDGLRIDLAGRDPGLQRGERLSPVQDRGSQGSVPARVALVTRLREGLALEQLGGDQEGPRERVDAADVGVEQVVPVGALAAQLGVEVEAAGPEATALEDLVDRQGEVLDRVRELIRVPAVLRVAPVGVDRAEDPVRDRVGDLVMEGVAGKRRVVRLDVQAVLVLE